MRQLVAKFRGERFIDPKCIREALGFARVVERQDVRMAQPGGGCYLAEESLTPERGGEVGLQYLDRDLAIVLLVLGEKDDPHPPTTEFTPDRVAVGEGGPQAGQRVRHGGLRIHRVVIAAFPDPCSGCAPDRGRAAVGSQGSAAGAIVTMSPEAPSDAMDARANDCVLAASRYVRSGHRGAIMAPDGDPMPTTRLPGRWGSDSSPSSFPRRARPSRCSRRRPTTLWQPTAEIGGCFPCTATG